MLQQNREAIEVKNIKKKKKTNKNNWTLKVALRPEGVLLVSCRCKCVKEGVRDDNPSAQKKLRRENWLDTEINWDEMLPREGRWCGDCATHLCVECGCSKPLSPVQRVWLARLLRSRTAHHIFPQTNWWRGISLSSFTSFDLQASFLSRTTPYQRREAFFPMGLDSRTTSGSPWASLQRRPIGRIAVGSTSGRSRDADPATLGLVTLPPQPCSHSACAPEKLLPGPHFQLLKILQVVPKHLRKCCQAFSVQLMKCCLWSRKKATNCWRGFIFLWLRFWALDCSRYRRSPQGRRGNSVWGKSKHGDPRPYGRSTSHTQVKREER